MRLGGGISSSNRIDVQRADSGQAAYHSGCAARRRSSMVRTALRSRAEPDESCAHTAEFILSQSSGDSGLFDLSGRVAIVTGTSRGLGQVFARALSRAGADLVLTSRTRAALADIEAEIKALGCRALSVELDVRDQASIDAMVASA